MLPISKLKCAFYKLNKLSNKGERKILIMRVMNYVQFDVKYIKIYSNNIVTREIVKTKILNVNID